MAPRGRPPTPVSAHKRRGTYRKHRHEGRDPEAKQDPAEEPAEEDEPEPEPETPAPAVPAHLDAETGAAWLEVATAARGAGANVLGSDSMVIEAAAVMLTNARRARRVLAAIGSRYYESRYGTSLHPAVRDEKGSWEAFHKAASLLGLSPIDRERLAAIGAGTGGGLDENAGGDPLDNLHQHRAPLKVVNGGKG